VSKGRGCWAATAAAAAFVLAATPASADTMAEALASAYTNNSTLNSARAQLRGIDENVPQALAGYRPVISANADASIQSSRNAFGSTHPSYPRGVSLTIEQPLFTGWRTTNSVKVAKLSVLAARSQLRALEQDVMLDAVRAFMAVVRAQVILNLRAQNVEFLREQVRAATDRLNVGEGTRTDVAQTNARLSAGLSAYNAAVAAVNSAIASYEQVIGHKPRALGNADGVDKLLPRSQQQAVDLGLRDHPSILAAIYNIDVASYNVKILEGALLPSASLQGSVSHRDGLNPSGSPLSSDWSDSASLTARLSVPIYEGGRPSSRVRQAKETLGQRRIDLDGVRALVKQVAISTFGTLDAARAQVIAAEAQVQAELLVLSGVQEERKVGQRTTLDVLNAQQELLNAREAQVVAQHDRVVAAYSLLAAIGKLDPVTLRLNVAVYDPSEHYDAVKDKWFGLRTPDGR
jgi:outer membrane protein